MSISADMRVVIAKVDEVFFDGEAAVLELPGAGGKLTVLPKHMPLITTLQAGVITLRETRTSAPRSFPITSGVAEVRSDGATVIL